MQRHVTSPLFLKLKCQVMDLLHSRLIRILDVPEGLTRLLKHGVYLMMYSVQVKKMHFFFCRMYSMRSFRCFPENMCMLVEMNVRKVPGKNVRIARRESRL